MVVGRELIIDVDNIIDVSLLETIDGIKPLMEKVIQNCNLNVVGMVEHQFQPYGATILYLLSESHLTIHTYVKERACSINLYTCNANTDFTDALDIIYKFFKQPYITKKIMER